MNWRESVENQVWREKRESLVVDTMTHVLEEYKAHKGLLANLACRWVLSEMSVLTAPNPLSDFWFVYNTYRHLKNLMF